MIVHDLSPYCCIDAFANFGLIVLSIGDPKLSYRLGTLAVKMIDRYGATKYKSTIFGSVHQFLSWIRDPFQLVLEMLKVGTECGQKAGDDWGVVVCRSFGLHTSYLAGESLVVLKESMRKFIDDVKRTQHRVFIVSSGETTALHEFTLYNAL